VLIFTEIWQDLANLAHEKSTQSESFLGGRLRIKIAFCSLRTLIYICYPHMVEMSTLKNPQKLLTNLGTLSKYARFSLISTKILKNLKFLFYLGYDGFVKESMTSYSTVPLILAKLKLLFVS
jgi:hypothetical protein